MHSVTDVPRYFTRSAERENPGAVHALGTGRILVYGQGPEWMQMIGAPYSCPSVFSLRFPDTEEIFCVSERTEGASDWKHSMTVRQEHRNNREELGEFLDTACREEHVILRRWRLYRPVTVYLLSDYPIDDVSALFAEGSAAVFSVSVPENAPVYNDYPVGTPTTAMLGIRCADAAFCTTERIAGGIALTLMGEGCIFVCGGEHFPCAHAALSGVMTRSPESLVQKQRTADAAYLSVCAENRARLYRMPIGGDAVNAAMEDVLFSIRAQQSERGGVMAGPASHLAYARDQYGVLRGLLAMGDFAGARAILQYCLAVEQTWGTVRNAQGMGDHPIFHIHENDHTEIPAYLVLGCIDYLNKTGDISFFAMCLGFCGRMLERSLPELVGGMMPFNGDESYISGGLLPRTVIEQGSLEATALLIAAAEQLEGACDRIGLPKDKLPGGLHDCRIAAELAFDENFARRGGGYTVNAPQRELLCRQPMYRHGVCYFGDSFGWLYGVDRGCYVCPRCAGKQVEPNGTEYRLYTAQLMVPYIGSALIGKPALAHTVRKMLSAYRKTGQLQPQGISRIVGYDFGLLLYAAAVSGVDADDLLTASLEARDDAGMWAEYYDMPGGPIPSGMRCRPRESAVNMDGILTYLYRQAEASHDPSVIQ